MRDRPLAEILHGSPYTWRMARKRIQIRPPGLKPTTKVGTLGPYRARLGLAWVIAPLVAGVVILVAAYLALIR
jgi:hypothetical protein